MPPFKSHYGEEGWLELKLALDYHGDVGLSNGLWEDLVFGWFGTSRYEGHRFTEWPWSLHIDSIQGIDEGQFSQVVSRPLVDKG